MPNERRPAAKAAPSAEDRQRRQKAVAACIVAAALALACLGIGWRIGADGQAAQPQGGPQASQPATDPGSAAQPDAAAPAAAAHVHDWTATYETSHVDAVTHTVEHPATYRQETSYETVCNSCGEVITGKAAAHIAATGHQGYTTDVPVANTVTDKEAWTETVVDTPAHDSTELTGYVCATCGEKRPAGDAEAEAATRSE